MRRSMWMALLTGAALLCGGESSRAQGDAASDSAIEFMLDLKNGRLLVRDLVKQVAAHFGEGDLATLQRLDWSIDVRSIAGSLQVEAIERLSRGLLDIDIADSGVRVRIHAPQAGEGGGGSQHGIGRLLMDVWKFDTARDHARFGLSFITAIDARARASDVPAAMREHVVVLVHGLDDPGMMWSDIVPALHAAGFTVARFDYPNDGPIAASADLLADELAFARQAGIERVSVVAHSMGGLVVRDALTRAEHYAGDGSGHKCAGRLPAIDRLIMLGTPHHGAEMARLRGVIELREYLFTAIATGTTFRELSGQDGRGEAGADLLPGSAFLTRLNAQPLASHTQYTIVAARLAPSRQTKVADSAVNNVDRLAHATGSDGWWRRAFTQTLPAATQRLMREAGDYLGDGCLSLKSAELEGVDDFVIVRASHIGMILNLSGGSVPPPAIPIVLERLSRPRDVE